MMKKFFTAVPLEQLLMEHRPNCLVADLFFPWLLMFLLSLEFPDLCSTGSASSPCVLRRICCVTSLISRFRSLLSFQTEFSAFVKTVEESELKSYGIIVNSCYELEPAYADHYRNVLGMKAWHVGPIFLCNKDREGYKVERGQETSMQDCLNWLDSKKPNSVIYVCFGSLANFDDSQLMEIAMGLEASGKQSLWVVKKGKHEEGVKEEWLPEGFEKRMDGKGLIVRGWAPQVLILQHQAVGAF